MILITGANGQLGSELRELISDAIFADRATLDITDANAVAKFVRDNKIDTIVNCAAYTAVDRAEDDVDAATRANVDGPANLAATGARIIHISTDYVFDGMGYKPYSPEDKTGPVSIYGKTKLNGEAAVLNTAKIAIVIRTSWVYSSFGNNFVKTMRRLGAERDTLGVVSDQVGTPTYAADLAAAIVKIIPQMNESNRGIYHFSNEGVCSWYDFATEIMNMSDLKCAVRPIKTSEYPTRAVRPFYSVLDKSKIKNTFGLEIRHWKDALKSCITKMNDK